MQLRFKHIARNVLFNWLGTIANMAVAILLSPFTIHHLGDVGYGVWTLANSSTSYLFLLDAGMQSSVLRFVSKGRTQGDHVGASAAISAALWVRIQLSVVVLILSGILAAVFPHLFKGISADFVTDARMAVALIGISTAIGMSLGVLGSVLSALNRYDLQNYANLTQTAIRAIGVVIVLRAGHGIVAIAVCELIAALAANLLRIVLALRLYPELRIHLKKPKPETLRTIWSYSWYAFLTTIAVQLVYKTDNLVVGARISAAAVAFYAIANNLVGNSDQLVGAMGSTFVPAASTYEAAGDTTSLLNLYKNGTRSTLMVSLPILITLIVRGPSFIGLWIGQEYSHISGTILIILCSALIFSNANRTAGAISFGVGKHKQPAFWAIGEGVANLTLSIILVRWFGIYGVAIGTLIPSLFIHIVLWPGYISKLVGLSYFEVIWNVWTPMFLAAVPFAIASYAVEVLFPAHKLYVFFLQTFALLPIFFLTVGLVFRTYVRNQIFPRVRSLFFAEVK